MVDFMLDNLGGPTEKFPDLGFKAYIKIFNGYKLETLCFADSGKGKASFLRFIFSGFFDDFRVEHYSIRSVVIKNDYAFFNSYHICGQPDASCSVCGKGIKKIFCCL